MKQALVNLYDAAKDAGLDFYLVGNIHDEIQAEVLEADCEEFGRLAVWAIEKAGDDLSLRCPVTGEYQIGESWYETH